MNREKNWHGLETPQLERIFRTDGSKGLSEKEAERRLRHGKNTVWQVKTASVKRYAVRSLFDLCTVLLVLAVAAAAFFGNARMAIAVFVILAVGRCARIAAHIWAERVLEKNARESLPRAKVVRGGTVRVVASDMIAPGDVIILDSGDTVPCDIRLTAADNILVAEENVTGKSGISSKNSMIVNSGKGGEVPLALRTNMVYASSVVISGFAIGIAVSTGDDTLICRREGRITLAGEKDVSTVEKLSDWGRICSLFLIAAALVITVVGVAFGDGSLADYFLPSISMAAAGLSEYIAAVGVLAWAIKLRGEGGCVLSRASFAEKAANTRIMALRNVSVMRSGKTTFHSYYTDKNLRMIGTKDAGVPRRLLRLACYCTGASPEGGIIQGNFGTRQRSASALPYRLVRSLWEDNKGSEAEENERYTILQHLPAGDVDSQGYDNILLAQGNDYYFACMGRVGSILSICSYQRCNGERVPLSEEDKRKILAFADELQRHGVTLAAVGFRDSHYNNLRRISVLLSNLCFEGFIAVSDRPAEGVVDSVREFRDAGGRMVIFSERGEEDRFYAEAEGIFRVGDLYLPAKDSVTVKQLLPEPGSLALIETPTGTEGMKERLRFMKLLAENEVSVSYVGYGVEDMWNMKSADVSFAVPTPQGSIPQGIRTEAQGIAEGEGGGFGAVCTLIDRCRAAILNIRNILSYLIASQVARLVLMLLSAAAGLELPGAAPLVLWGVILDFSVAFATATVPGGGNNTRLRLGRLSATPDSPGAVLLPTLYGSILAVVSCAVPFIAKLAASAGGFAPALTPESLMTCSVAGCFIALPFIGAEFAGGYGLFSKRSKLSVYYILPPALSVLSVVLMLFAPPVREAFGTQFPGFIMTAFSLVPCIVTVGVMSVVRAVKRK